MSKEKWLECEVLDLSKLGKSCLDTFVIQALVHEVGCSAKISAFPTHSANDAQLLTSSLQSLCISSYINCGQDPGINGNVLSPSICAPCASGWQEQELPLSSVASSRAGSSSLFSVRSLSTIPRGFNDRGY